MLTFSAEKNIKFVTAVNSLHSTSRLIFTMKQLDTSTSPKERRDAGDVSPLPLVCIDFMQQQHKN